MHNSDGGAISGIRAAWRRLRRHDDAGCALCALTRGLFGANPRWESYLASRPESVEDVTRDRFRADHPASSWRNLELPAILELNGSRLQVLVSARAIRRSPSAVELIATLDQALTDASA